MYILIIGCALFGIILSRFFRVYVLFPVCVIILGLTVMSHVHAGHSLANLLLDVFLVISSLQIGFLAGAMAPSLSVVLQHFGKMLVRGSEEPSNWSGRRRTRQSSAARLGGISAEAVEPKPAKKIQGM
jgi:hypothetical protein